MPFLVSNPILKPEYFFLIIKIDQNIVEKQVSLLIMITVKFTEKNVLKCSCSLYWNWNETMHIETFYFKPEIPQT